MSSTVKTKETASSAVMQEDEAATRRITDEQLRASGWKADSVKLRYSRGARPKPGINQAIAEWPTSEGPADYVLFIGLIPYAIVEVKRMATDVPGVILQAKRYSRAQLEDIGALWPGAPWGEFYIPFVFATNGRPYLRQVQEKSGIWFQDLRLPTNHPRPLSAWYTPDGLKALAKSEDRTADAALKSDPVDFPGLRDYQAAAITAVEKAIATGQREILVAMATGTGKTRVCISMLYRLLKANRFRRVLFLVDRSALGEQATDAFKDVRLENLKTFTEIYDVKELSDRRPDEHTRLHLATVQGMVKRILHPEPGQHPIPVDQYDCIVVDECHRGYNLDQQLSDAEFEFRDEEDYISQYRRVLDHFDSVKIGLTATQALHTAEIFGDPVFSYSYRQAVIDGWLVDHEPPIQIATQLSKLGIKWRKGEKMKVYERRTGTVVNRIAPDDIGYDVVNFNKKVLTAPFNKVVCEELARHIDPELPGKSLVFCVNDSHADRVVRLLKSAMEKQYGPLEDQAVAKITGKIDEPLKEIRRFKNESLPKIAVTVDLLTTGIDVPEIVNLVFIRAVRSRILYDQMLGRGTRLCEDLFGPGLDKEFFRIFDAVNLYATLKEFSDMKPVITKPEVTFVQLTDELRSYKRPSARRALLEMLIVKLHRKNKLLAAHAETFHKRFGLNAHTFIKTLSAKTPEAVARLFKKHADLAQFLDDLRADPLDIPISEHPDRISGVLRGYGPDLKKPEDYIEGFTKWLKQNINKIPALKVVTRRPRDLTRVQLIQIKTELDAKGYNETTLKAAWHELKNEDIAATIIGFIRNRALGSPLIPYPERVDRALKSLLAERPWTAPQRRWLDILANQIKAETIVDRPAIDTGLFMQDGGFTRLNRIFNGQFEGVLHDLQDRIWTDPAA
jgi:type I restriction enzyme R subunit